MSAPPDETASPGQDLHSMTKAQLTAYARANGVALAGGAMRKAEIIAAIEGGR